MPDGCILAPFLERVIVSGFSQQPIHDLQARHKPVRILTYQKPSTSYKLAEAWASKRLPGHFEINEVNLTRPDGLPTSVLAALPKWRDEYDIVVMTEPELSWFRSSGPGVDIDIHQELYGNDPYALTSILSTRGFVKTNPEIARRFLKALRLAFQLANRAGAVEAASSATVKRAIAAVYRLSSSSYPTEYMVKEEAVGSMMAHLSKIRAFPDSILLDAEQRISLTRAYNLHFPHTVQAGALIDERIIDVTSDLDLMA